ncbi:MAG: phosphoribosylaminoimidazolesuccinocarboxamide synthase [Lachnospiraceae bacterium]|nr:phosphoribosylaminoimidazolesuccinocarboxamide synthase [Lachnospiraceae bacterium]
MAIKEWQPIKEGKVRKVYDIGDAVVMVCTDRISAFDVVLKNRIEGKGRILTQMSKFWFDLTSDIIPNHMISIEEEDLPEFFHSSEFRGKSMKCRKLAMLPVECIVRGYITGSGWESYCKDGTVCGIRLPKGLVESQKLPEPIYTPTTKADLGLHDEHMRYEDTVSLLEEQYPGRGEEYAQKIRDATLALYRKCADYAYDKGIIIADTKFEFGLDESGEVILADEMLTPDSSRFWPRSEYEAGRVQPSFDKQYVRDWLKAHPDNDGSLPEDVIWRTIEKYQEAFELLTGSSIAD